MPTKRVKIHKKHRRTRVGAAAALYLKAVSFIFNFKNIYVNCLGRHESEYILK